LATLEASIEKSRRFFRYADDLVRCLAVKFEVDLGFRPAVIPVGKLFEFAAPQWPHARAVRLTAMLTRGVCRATPRFFAIASAEVTTPRAMRPCPPSFSLAKTNTVSPLAMCLPPYIVFCAANTNVLARRSRTSVLIANAMLADAWLNLNAVMYFIGFKVNHPLSLDSNITDATAMQVYHAVVYPGLVFANWRYARSPRNSPITTQAQ
jgi:hypothetical protein